MQGNGNWINVAVDDRTPYIYFLLWESRVGGPFRMYIGSQHSKGCHPDNLWKTYFTSSEYVEQHRKSHGDPDKIYTIECVDYVGQAGIMEEMFLKKVNAERNPHFLNASNLGRHTPKYCYSQIAYVFGLLGSIHETAYALDISVQQVATKLYNNNVDYWNYKPKPTGQTVVNWCKGITKPRGATKQRRLELV